VLVAVRKKCSSPESIMVAQDCGGLLTGVDEPRVERAKAEHLRIKDAVLNVKPTI
jgi:hypothetical protein